MAAMTPRPFLHPMAKPTFTDFVTIARAEGAAVFDDQGKRYVDALASLWYCAAGHGQARIIDAVASQLRTLDTFHTFDIFTNAPAEVLAERIAALAPIDDPRVFFTNSGSEAVDTALKLARLTHQRNGEPDRQLLVGRSLSYHGTNFGGVSVQGLPLNRAGWGQLLDPVTHVPHDSLDAANALFADKGEQIAAVIAEPVVGAGGVYPATREYLHGLRELCTEHGALLILDEVITGFGRLGTWFGAQHYDVVPDLLTFAKAVTSGYQPLGGVIVGAEVRAQLESDDTFILRHGYTYSGNPASSAAGLANLDVLADDRLLHEVPRIAEHLGDGLTTLVDKGLLGAVRGVGAIWSVDVTDDAATDPARDALAVRAGLLERGVIARPIGPTTVAFCPPLVIGDADLDHILDALRDTLENQ
jgi:adenosylmethionine-8-amino-7-oxononanoate aminotransferase